MISNGLMSEPWRRDESECNRKNSSIQVSGRGDDFLEVLLEEGFPKEGSREGGTVPAGAGNTAHLVPTPWPGPPRGLHRGDQVAPQLHHPQPPAVPTSSLSVGCLFRSLTFP